MKKKMKKKINDLTIADIVRICSEHAPYCEFCGLSEEYESQYGESWTLCILSSQYPCEIKELTRESEISLPSGA